MMTSWMPRADEISRWRQATTAGYLLATTRICQPGESGAVGSTSRRAKTSGGGFVLVAGAEGAAELAVASLLGRDKGAGTFAAILGHDHDAAGDGIAAKLRHGPSVVAQLTADRDHRSAGSATPTLSRMPPRSSRRRRRRSCAGRGRRIPGAAPPRPVLCHAVGDDSFPDFRLGVGVAGAGERLVESQAGCTRGTKSRWRRRWRAFRRWCR